MLLAGDIGGTKTILSLQEATDQLTEQIMQKSYVSADYPDLHTLVEKFLQETGQILNQEISIDKACFAVAGPVQNNQSTITNLNWTDINGDHLQNLLNIPQVAIINDFAGVGYGVLGLSLTNPADIIALTPHVLPQPQGNIAILGAGTGLGQAFLVWNGTQYEVKSTEGGHSDFAVSDDLSYEFMKYLQKKYGKPVVDVERVVSGPGIEDLYAFLSEKADPTKVIDPPLSAGKIAELANNHTDAKASPTEGIAQQTMEMFVKYYGAEASNLAFKILPYGGIYIAGGIAPKNLTWLTNDQSFIKAFKNKDRVVQELDKMPIYVVTNDQVGLIGAMLYAINL